MCDQPVPKAVEDSFRKPKAQWQVADYAVTQSWAKEPLHDPGQTPAQAQKNHLSRLSYIQVSELLFIPYMEMTAAQKEQLHGWLSHPCRLQYFVYMARHILNKHKMAALLKSEMMEDWATEFIEDCFADLLPKFNPARAPLYGYIAGPEGRFIFWCRKKGGKLLTMRKREPFAADLDIDLDGGPIHTDDEDLENVMWRPAGLDDESQADGDRSAETVPQNSDEHEAEYAQPGDNTALEPVNKTTKKTDKPSQHEPEPPVVKTNKNWHQCSPEEQTAYLMLLEAIDQLKPRYRDILLLRFIEGYTNQEIAEILRITPNNVGNRVFLAKEALAALLEPSTKKH
jgi:RNA polymerase sigma factor (sigma-70 family)